MYDNLENIKKLCKYSRFQLTSNQTVKDFYGSTPSIMIIFLNLFSQFFSLFTIIKSKKFSFMQNKLILEVQEKNYFLARSQLTVHPYHDILA